jgi:hypothetical protein
MTNITKNEKLLRKATSKWSKFLAEGAFKKTVNEFNSDDAEHFDSKDPWEYNVADDYKIGDKIMIRNPRTYLIPAEDDHKDLECRTGIVKAFDGKDKIMVLLDDKDGGEPSEIIYIHGRNASNNPVEWKSPYINCPEEQVNEFNSDDAYHFDVDKGAEERLPPEAKSATYWVEKGDKVRIYGRDNKNVPQVPEEYKCRYAIVKGFSKENDQDVIVQFDDGKVANFTHSSMSRNPGTWEMDFFYPCEDNLNEMTMGERGMQDAQDGNPPSKIGGGLEDYMSAYNAVMQKMGKEPLPIVQPDQAYLDALSRGNLEESESFAVGDTVTAGPSSPHAGKKLKVKKVGGGRNGNMTTVSLPNGEEAVFGSEHLTLSRGNLEEMGPATGHVEGTDAAGVIRQIAADLNEVSGVMNNASSTTTASEFAGFIQAKAAELLEAADELGIDGPAPALQENEKKSFKVGEFVHLVSGGLRGATGKIAEPTTLVTGEEGYVIHLYSDADSKVFGKQGDEVIAGASRIKSGGTFDGSELYDIDEAVSGKEQYYLKQQNRAKGAAMALYHEAGGEGTTTPGPFVKQQANIIVAAMVALERMITSDNIDETAQWGGFTGGAAPLDEPVRDSGQVPLDQLKKLFSIFTEMGLSPDAILQKPEFAEAGITNPAQLDERSADDERDLEAPVKYALGTLELEPKTGKFYDRSRDIYLSDEEADEYLKPLKEAVRKALSQKKKLNR